MAVPVPPIMPARHRRRTYRRPAPRIPWFTLSAVVGLTAGIVLTAVADDTTRALLAVAAVTYLVLFGIHRTATHFTTEEQGR